MLRERGTELAVEAVELTSAVNASAAGHGWSPVERAFEAVTLRRYSWLEYRWGNLSPLPGTVLTVETAPALTVSLLRRDLKYPVATLQGPTGWVAHEPGEYVIACALANKAEAVGGRIVPSVRLVSVDQRPRVSWTSEAGLVGPFSAQSIPNHARYVYGWQTGFVSAGVLVEWFAGTVPRFSGPVRLQTAARAAVPDGATHFRQIDANTAFSFE